VPTPFGMALLKRSVVVFDELRQGIKDLEFLADPDAGEVRIAAPIALSTGIVAAAVARLTKRHPRIVCHLMIEEHSRVFRRLEERDVDLAIVFLPTQIPEDQMEAQFLYDGHIVVVVAKNNPLSRKRRLKLADLMNEPWTLPPPDHEFGLVYGQAFRQAGYNLPPARVVTISVITRLALVAKTRLITVASEPTFRFDARDMAITALPIDLGETRISVGIMTLKNRTVTPVARRFIECAKEAAMRLQ
jgi:DNA-binding transcriptional LysR family regulator